jgi:putative ABC transport system permease protein
MSTAHLILREILHRKLNFLLAAFSVAAAVACVIAQLSLLHRHDLATEKIVADKEAETREKMAKLEEDYRKITLGMGFNVLILPKDQNLGDFYAEDFASKMMPEEYASRLAKSRVATINHIMPSLQQKVLWKEAGRSILLMGIRGEVYVQSAQQKPLLYPVAPGSIVLGHELHQGLNLKEGDKVQLQGHEFTVSKLNPPRGNKDDITAWINLPEAQEILGKEGLINGILALDCTCDTINRLALIRAEIERILPDTQIIEFQSQALARAEARQRAGVEAQASIEAEIQNRAKLRRSREAFAAILVPLVVLGAGVWIALLALGNVRDRRSEIGILRALGLRTHQILWLFLGRAVLAGFLGALAGFVVGVFAAAPLLLSYQLPFLPAVLLAAPLLAALAAWLPAYWAAQQDPAVILSAE